MRLLNTKTHTLHTFFGKAIPKYAILSHRWEDEEVLFQDLESGRGRKMPGYAKIRGCCARASRENFEYAWIDTCCIDKSSSAELSEAINSMFQWYKDSQVCYVYLSDVDGRGNEEQVLSEFAKSVWFDRGWTLQELLAPNNVVFYDRSWRYVGTKNTLEQPIAEITGIQRLFSYGNACIAEKMSWASRRETTRIEDEAYCLMGLFGVNMPLLYGEGAKAFKRLQQEIIKSSDDESIFTWYLVGTSLAYTGSDVFAPTPRAFSDSWNVKSRTFVSASTSTLIRNTYEFKRAPADYRVYFKRDEHPYAMTNKGLHISLFLIPAQVFGIGPSSTELYVALLHGLWMGSNDMISPAIFLERIYEQDEEIMSWTDAETWKLIRIPQHRILSLDLRETMVKCQAWTKDHSSAFMDNEDHRLRPKSRLVHIRTDTRTSYEIPKFQGYLNDDFDMLINIKSLRAHSFELLWPCRSRSDPTLEGTNVSCLGTVDGNLRLKFKYPFSAEPLVAVYFTSSKIGQTLMFIVNVRDSGNPWLMLLTLGSDQRSIMTLDDMYIVAESWFEHRSSKYSGVNRISHPLDNGWSVSAFLRRVVDGLGYKYIIDLTIDRSGSIRWPATNGLETLANRLAEDIDFEQRRMERY